MLLSKQKSTQPQGRQQQNANQGSLTTHPPSFAIGSKPVRNVAPMVLILEDYQACAVLACTACCMVPARVPGRLPRVGGLCSGCLLCYVA